MNKIDFFRKNIWLFLDVLKREQSLNTLTVHQILAGEAAPPQRRIYRNITQRLQNLLTEYDSKTRLDFLRGIALNLQF